MDPANFRECLREAALDEAEGGHHDGEACWVHTSTSFVPSRTALRSPLVLTRSPASTLC